MAAARTLKGQLAIAVSSARAGRKAEGSDPGPGRRPGGGAAKPRVPAGRRCRVRPGSGWGGVFFLMLVGSAAASPLYSVSQARCRFSATTLTAVFAVYVLALLLTLLVFGSLSDYLGRRHIIAVALAVGACGLFLAAHHDRGLRPPVPTSRKITRPPHSRSGERSTCAASDGPRVRWKPLVIHAAIRQGRAASNVPRAYRGTAHPGPQ
jgi:hypothetical protein